MNTLIKKQCTRFNLCIKIDGKRCGFFSQRIFAQYVATPATLQQKVHAQICSMKKFLCIVISLIVITGAQAQDATYEKHWYLSGTDSMGYRLLLPENYNPKKKYPLVYFLHGAGERGSDNERQLIHGAKLFAKAENRSAFPAIIVIPQCPQNSFWSNVSWQRDSAGGSLFIFDVSKPPTTAMKMADGLLHWVLKNYAVQKKQVYIGGLSMGGMGTFEMVYRNPKIFAAAFPICGGGDPSTAPQLKKTSWWVFHGDADAVVPPKYSKIMVTALQGVKAPVKFTLYPGVNHNSWDNAFAEPGLLPWLFAQKKH